VCLERLCPHCLRQSTRRSTALIGQHSPSWCVSQDMDYLVRKLRDLLGDMTFFEAYERTGRILNVSVSPADTNEPPRLLNYLTAPQALIWSAVAASSAFPGLFPAQHLLARNAQGEVVRWASWGCVARCPESVYVAAAALRRW